MFKIAACFSILAMLSSCSAPSLIWKDDGKSMEDLRYLRQRNRPLIELARGVVLYADSFHFSGKHHRAGEALGHVFLDVTPEARDIWLLRYGYAGRASFDIKKRTLTLSEMPVIEWRMMTQIATAPSTTVQIHWSVVDTDIAVNGPTRSDFLKSSPPSENVTQLNQPGSPNTIKPLTPGRNTRNP